jgi:hypothetical protein
MQIGGNIHFGKYDWKVLDIQDDKALIITKNIIEQRAYHDAYVDITWAQCELRTYLNGEFYDRFTEAEKAKIITVTNKNPANQWYGTFGGEDTLDKVFVLDIEDAVCRYFGDSSMNLQRQSEKQKYWFNRKDENNGKRVATFKDSEWWYWLRSPGRAGIKAAYVHGDGNIGIQGNNIFKCNIGLFHRAGDNKGGVRPALWMSIS